MRISIAPAMVLVATCVIGQRRDWALDSIELKLPPEVRERCHIVRFPRGWRIPPIENYGQRVGIDYRSEYEFRVSGLLGTRFLVGTYTAGINSRYYSANHYRVDLSDPTAHVATADPAEWDAAFVVPLSRKEILSTFGPGKPPNNVEFNGFPFTRSGSWEAAFSWSRLSPDSSWLVLHSVSDEKVHFPWVDYSVFFDTFNARTGTKLFTLKGKYSGVGDAPFDVMERAAWLTERYFVIPLGKHKERCVVCEFVARREAGGKP